MDEITLDEKKYVSTKRAAKVTGYAKDYVGQLAREGRVPARLVGRSWYVLESAIQDHRFGVTQDSDEKGGMEAKKEHLPKVSVLEDEWGRPTYTSDPAPELPSINRLHVEQKEYSEAKEAAPEEGVGPVAVAAPTPSSLHDAWQEWFSARGADPQELELPVGEDDSAPGAIEEEEVVVPIRTVYKLDEPAETQEPVYEERKEEIQQQPVPAQREQRGRRRPLGWATRSAVAAGLVVSLAFAGIATLNSGYVDTYAVMSTRVAQISGIAIYYK